MEQRLQLFLQMEQLTQSQFADRMGIQRSGVTHLLSGRNKPSFEFITRMLQTFPSLNAEWLILGKGKPYKNSPSTPAETQPEETLPDVAAADLFSEPELPQPVETTETISFDRVPQIPVNEVKEPIIKQAHQPKAIKSILILYEDGTYEKR